jgi:glutathione S-transferase
VKLYNANLSPWTTSCRIQIYAKNLPVEMVEPPGGPTSEEYRRKNPLGKIPALEVDGVVIPESAVICEYLEDAFPTPSLRPERPLERARMRLLVRFHDLYLTPPLYALFSQLDPATRDTALVKEKLGELEVRLDQLEGLLVATPYAAGPSLSLADCALAPFFFFATRVLPMFGAPSPLTGRPRTAGVGEVVGKHPAVAKVLDEMSVALEAWMKARA